MLAESQGESPLILILFSASQMPVFHGGCLRRTPSPTKSKFWGLTGWALGCTGRALVQPAGRGEVFSDFGKGLTPQEPTCGTSSSVHPKVTARICVSTPDRQPESANDCVGLRQAAHPGQPWRGRSYPRVFAHTGNSNLFSSKCKHVSWCFWDCKNDSAASKALGDT